MKRTTRVRLPVPRLNSLLHRLLRTPSPGGEPRLDQLMSFIDHPPSGIRDRWKAGAAMCAAWGISTTGASVWRLHQSFLAHGQARYTASE